MSEMGWPGETREDAASLRSTRSHACGKGIPAIKCTEIHKKPSTRLDRTELPEDHR